MIIFWQATKFTQLHFLTFIQTIFGYNRIISLYTENKLNNKQFKGVFTTHLKGAEHLSLTNLQLFSPILVNTLQSGKANIDSYYCIEMENELILKFFDCELKEISHFNSKKTY